MIRISNMTCTLENKKWSVVDLVLNFVKRLILSNLLFETGTSLGLFVTAFDIVLNLQSS